MMRLQATTAVMLAAALLTFGSMAAAQPATTIEIEMGTPEGQKVFVPDQLRLPAGESLRLVLVNRSDNDHAFVAPDLMQHADVRLLDGESAKATLQDGAVTVGSHGQAVLALRIARPGTYDFRCPMPGHAEWGMRGTLTVE